MTTSNKPTLLYILAPSYSGSTLLTMLLARHPEISTVGELNFKAEKRNMQTFRCSCGRALRTCSFWKQLSARCEERGIAFSVDNMCTDLTGDGWLTNKLLTATYKNNAFASMRAALITLLPQARRHLDSRLARIFEVTQAICEVQRGRVFLDSSKHPIRLYHFVHSNLWDVKVIYLVRDGRGVTCSSMSHRQVGYDAAIRRWRAVAREMYRLRGTLPAESVIDVKYEDLCRHPSATVSRILQRSGLKDREMPNANAAADDYHILGNDMRLRFQAEIKLDERWKSVLDGKDLDLFHHLAGDVNRQLGYSE